MKRRKYISGNHQDAKLMVNQIKRKTNPASNELSPSSNLSEPPTSVSNIVFNEVSNCDMRPTTPFNNLKRRIGNYFL